MNQYIYPVLKLCALSLAISICVSCNENNQQTQVGYIEGEYTYIASNVPGTLHELAVSRGQEVKKGQLLFQLDHEPEASSVEATTANNKNLVAQVDFYKKQLERQQYLFDEKATSKMNLEKAQIEYDSYVQQLAANNAKLIETQWSLDQKTLLAPVNGQVFDTFYQAGEKIMAYKPVIAMLDPQNLTVIFYLPEKDLDRVKVGEVVTFDCDGCREKTQATVAYISPMAEYTPPFIYNKDSRDNLVYLVRANMPVEVAKKFRPGQPIDVSLHE
jgi:HlyD family secretion protein